MNEATQKAKARLSDLKHKRMLNRLYGKTAIRFPGTQAERDALEAEIDAAEFRVVYWRGWRIGFLSGLAFAAAVNVILLVF